MTHPVWPVQAVRYRPHRVERTVYLCQMAHFGVQRPGVARVWPGCGQGVARVKPPWKLVSARVARVDTYFPQLA